MKTLKTSFFVLVTVMAGVLGCGARIGGSPYVAPSKPLVELNDGSIVLSRLAPQIVQSGGDSVSAVLGSTVLGFLPMRSTPKVLTISIPKENQPSEVAPGRYLVIHKQEYPSWHATDDYYSVRGLPAPEMNSRARFLRGALGDKAIFLAAGGENHSPLSPIPVFSSTTRCAEVKGLRLAQPTLDQIFSELEVGGSVEVE